MSVVVSPVPVVLDSLSPDSVVVIVVAIVIVPGPVSGSVAVTGAVVLELVPPGSVPVLGSLLAESVAEPPVGVSVAEPPSVGVPVVAASVAEPALVGPPIVGPLGCVGELSPPPSSPHPLTLKRREERTKVPGKRRINITPTRKPRPYQEIFSHATPTPIATPRRATTSTSPRAIPTGPTSPDLPARTRAQTNCVSARTRPGTAVCTCSSAEPRRRA